MKPQHPELRPSLIRLAARSKSLETQAKLLADGQRELRGKVDRLLYAIICIGAAIIAAMIINQVVG